MSIFRNKQFLENLIARATEERLRDLNRDYVKLTQISFDLRERLKSADLFPEVKTALEGELRWAERNLIERYHANIESKCHHILNSLRKGIALFYEDESLCGDFVYFLSLQFFRTAKMRKGLSDIHGNVPGHDARRTANILNHILATNVSVGLFRERKAYRIVFLKNETSSPFIAGDQPVLNMLDPKATNDLELYYPLSPRLAMVLTKDVARFPDRERNVTLFEVERYNYAVYGNSEDQIYSSDEDYLRQLVATKKNVLW